ncbi:MAG TPA: flavodoxin [Candidatus Flavonifractor intestinipullorum]|uniref:Flavodoxin n=1 Tax=Candidatus Flavonifractor intestinipullorum TaxID=2838587 RepID=A0A9D2MCI6_9FIRM|nr:flavodoxin [Candidatus Flavonifractor intestinipullorum]
MKIWKRLSGCLLAGTMLLALAACGQSGADSSTGAQSSGQVQQEPAEATPPVNASEDTAAPEDSGGESTAESGSVLVVYYSASGHTETVANYIAQATGGDLFEITPAEPYTSADLNWSDENSRVSREYADESLRDVELTTTQVENWDSYDTVFIGYPIWWGIAAWPVDGFVAANDFTGKTVIPFCTSSSSGLGESGELLAELAGTGDWQEGERFRSSASQEDVNQWVDSLGLSA